MSTWPGTRRSPLRAQAPAVAMSLLSLACRPAPAAPHELLVPGLDYAFQLPDTLAAGPIRFGFHNAGKVPHEMAIARLKEGVTLSQVLETVRAGGEVEALLDGMVGILIAFPGDTALGRLETEFQAGRTYVFGCNFRDGPDQPPHVELGMVKSVAVR